MDFNGPSYMRTARNKTPVIHADRIDELQIGKGVVLKDGHDVAIIACGVLVSKSLEAAAKLEADGISATVVDMHTIKPLDTELVDRLVASNGCLVSAEDHSIIGGLGGALAEHICSTNPVPLERVGVRDRFGESGQAEEMLDLLSINTGDIIEAAMRAIARKNGA